MLCVDLGESFQTHIYLQNLALIQPRTSLPTNQPTENELLKGCRIPLSLYPCATARSKWICEKRVAEAELAGCREVEIREALHSLPRGDRAKLS